MAKRLKAMGQAKYQADGDPRTSGPGFAVTCHHDELRRPMGWRKPRMVFVNSMSDLFHQDVTDEFVSEVWTAMARARQHTYQVLTKRSQRAASLVARIAWRSPTTEERAAGERGDRAYLWDDGIANQLSCGGPRILPNVWLGVSIESDRYTFRADHLRATPAAVRFVSLEPLLGPLPSLDLTGIDWAIVGAESGRGARPMDLDWAREIVDKARQSGTAVFVKQLSGGIHAVKDLDLFPEDLRIREYPGQGGAS
jgi:protein gp37